MADPVPSWIDICNLCGPTAFLTHVLTHVVRSRNGPPLQLPAARRLVKDPKVHLLLLLSDEHVLFNLRLVAIFLVVKGVRL
jgi:hypothetical protein